MADDLSPHDPSTTRKSVDAVVVGAGFAGLYMLHRLRGLGFSVTVFEAGDGVGGTWYWNRYPGARCDVESMAYSYSFSKELEQEWVWSERYAPQPEILRYLNHVADRFDLRRDIQLNTRVTGAVFDEQVERWTVRTDGGDIVSARFCIMATGCLSAPRVPDIPGVESFAGSRYHTAEWPHDGVDFTGQRVGVIGTGSTAIQAIPIIAQQAEHLTVFQRTPNFSVPAYNAPLDPGYERQFKDSYPEIRQQMRESHAGFFVVPSEESALAVSEEERRARFEARWKTGGIGFLGAFNDIVLNPDANALAAEFIHDQIRQIVHDPEVAERLLPKDHPVGTKRLCVDTDYYATFNRPNVTLVDVRAAPIEEITPTGLRTAEHTYELDSIVFATGFDAMTGTLLSMDIRGRSGRTLKETWAHGPVTYLGLAVAGFPNLFVVTGPGSPSVLSNMVVSIEQHVDWIADAMVHLRDREATSLEATEPAQKQWVEHVNDVAGYTLFPQANSWYIGANIPGKPRVFMPYVAGVGLYRQICDGVAARGYEGFVIGGVPD